MVIYRFTNKANHKVYVGQTVKILLQRVHMHRWSVLNNSKQAFHCAVRKYGWDNFRLEVLHCARSINELNAMETFFIILHQSHRPKFGYNRNLGGYKRKNAGQVPWNKGKRGAQVAWNKGREMGAEFSEKCRSNPQANAETAARARAAKGPVTEEWKTLMSEKFTGEGNPFFGRKHTAETSAKMSEAKRRRLATDPAYRASLIARLKKR